MATTTQTYPVKQEGDMEVVDFNDGSEANFSENSKKEVKINTAGTAGKLFNMLEDEDDANIILVEDLFPPLLAKFMKIFGGVHSFGKGAQVDVVKYYVFWTTINLVFANSLACWLYIAGADAIFAWIIAVSYVPAVMTGAEAEINMFKSSYTGAILSRSEVRKNLRAGILGGCIFFGIVSFGILWALPVFTILLPYAQRGDLPVGVQIGFYTYIYGSPLASIAAMLNMHFAGIVPLHQKEVIVRIRNAIKVMSTILSDEKLSGIEARKRISKVQELAVNQIHNELTQQGNQNTSMLSYLACIVAITIYLAVAPLDKSRSQATAAMVMRFLFYFQSMISLVSVFIFNLRSAATPNNIWHDFTDSIHKNPHLLCLTVRKFDNKLELLNLWVEKNIITFRLFGVSIDRYLPGKIFAGMTSIAISAGFVIGRMTGTF